MKVEARGLIYDATADRPPNERIAFFTSLFPLCSGTILSTVQLGTSKHGPDSTLRMHRSRDGGNTWQDTGARFPREVGGVPGSYAAGEMVEVEPGRLMMCTTWFDRSEPDRPLFDPVSEGILHDKQLRAFSSDEGTTWSKWEEIPRQGLTGCALCGPLVRWTDGTIGYAFESFKEYDDPRPARHAAWLLLSPDGGRTFPRLFKVAQHPEHRLYYWDQRVFALPKAGEFLALFWTHDLAEKKDLNVHFRRGSIDEPAGESAQVRETSIQGQIAAPLVLDDGRWLAFVVDRNKPPTMKLWVSHDQGNTWPEHLLVYNHDEQAKLTQGTTNVDFKQYWEDMGKWSFGHPSIRLLDRNHALLSHYAGTPEMMSAHWVRVCLD
jgi:hypothetical protein